MHDILTALFSWIPGQNTPVVASGLKGHWYGVTAIKLRNFRISKGPFWQTSGSVNS